MTVLTAQSERESKSCGRISESDLCSRRNKGIIAILSLSGLGSLALLALHQASPLAIDVPLANFNRRREEDVSRPDDFVGNPGELVTPEQAAANLQSQSWVSRLRITELNISDADGRRIAEWSTHPPVAEGVDIFLRPFSRRSRQLVDLFLHGKVTRAMGENMVMLGWAKAALALGCRRVVMFESDLDFVQYLSREEDQVYITDFRSLPPLKDELLVEDSLRRRTWELAFWGRTQHNVQTDLGISDEYGFRPDHSLLPYNYTDYKKAPHDNLRIGTLPTAITMNHMRPSADQTQQCQALFMGKTTSNLKKIKHIIKMVDDKLLAHKPYRNVTICTGMRIGQNRSLQEFLGFSTIHVVNLGRMQPADFAKLVGSARVVVGSGDPKCPPTSVDTIFGGGVFMAPSVQFRSMEEHPLFVKADRAFRDSEEQADRIVELVLEEGGGRRPPFGGFDANTSYGIEHVCRQILRVIRESKRI